MIKPAEPADVTWITDFLRERWNSTIIVTHGEIIEAAALPALIAENHRGLATYRRLGRAAELVALDAAPTGQGIGTALIEALTIRLQAGGCTQLWVTVVAHPFDLHRHPPSDALGAVGRLRRLAGVRC